MSFRHASGTAKSRWTKNSAVWGLLMLLICSGAKSWAGDAPGSADPRIRVELFAEHPEIVTPTGLAMDDRGRVFVAESHTHFRPEDYDGPTADRILIFEDTDDDGRADKKTIFHEGFTFVMDVELHYDGSLYVATRKDIHRLRDTNGDDRADEVTPIVRLETKGNYPHNGLSGIAFTLDGGFHFGLGENLGEAYTLIGSDGVTLSGGGEGGSTYWVDDQGGNLRRVSTGWWNPYGLCSDSWGRVFGTDNDPDASPPCRLLQVVEGGDYGYEFRYGRSGRNPLVAWDGEIPGTLPMIAGTGEAPCHIVSYESDGLPRDYFGSLLVPSWADHRVEYYVLEQSAQQGLVTTRRQTLVSGGDDFRPAGIDVAPDGSVYISDWVSSSYTLHKQGRIWRIRAVEKSGTTHRPQDQVARLTGLDRRAREAAGRELARTAEGRQILAQQARQAELAQARATCLQLLSRQGQHGVAKEIADDAAAEIPLRVIAVRELLRANEGWSAQNAKLPAAVRAESLLGTQVAPARDVSGAAQEQDPLLRHAAVVALASAFGTSSSAHLGERADVPELLRLLALKRGRTANRQLAEHHLGAFLRSSDPKVQFCAVKWVADDQLTQYRPQLLEMLTGKSLDIATYLALQVALQRLDGARTLDRPPNERLLETITAADTPAAIRRLALRLIDPSFPALRTEHLLTHLKSPDEAVRLEALRTLCQHPDDRRVDSLVSIAANEQEPSELRATAVAGLALRSSAHRDLLVKLAAAEDARVRAEALRSLVATELTEQHRAALRLLANSASHAEAVARVVDNAVPTRPPITDSEAWLAILSQPGDVLSGERIFFGAKVGTCSKCHQAAGRGAAVGPDLSRISDRVTYLGQGGRRWLLETILHPSRDMAPQYTPWSIVTKDGRQFTGLPRRKGGNSEAYLGVDGREFTLKNDEIESHHEASVSIMPADLLQQLTTQELADLFAFLTQRG